MFFSIFFPISELSQPVHPATDLAQAEDASDAAPLAEASPNEAPVLQRWRRAREEAMQLWATEILGSEMMKCVGYSISFHPFIYPSDCLSIYLSDCLSVSISISFFLSLSLSIYIYIYIHLIFYSNIHQCRRRSDHLLSMSETLCRL